MGEMQAGAGVDREGGVAGAALMVLTGGVVAGFAVWSAPVGLVERLVAASGISAMVPAAAPPLGQTARLVLAGLAALVAMALAAALRGVRPKGENHMGFALSKLWRRGREGVPVRRRADAHPDSPPRRPLIASMDLAGTEGIRRRRSFLAPPAEAEAAFLQGVRLSRLPEMDEAEAEPSFTRAAGEEPRPIVLAPAESPPRPIRHDAGKDQDYADFEPLSRGHGEDPVAPDGGQGGASALSEISAAVAGAAGATPAERSVIDADILKALADALPPLDDLSLTQLAVRFEQGLTRRAALLDGARTMRPGGGTEEDRTEDRTAWAGEPKLAPGHALNDADATSPVVAGRQAASRDAVQSYDADMEVGEALRAALDALPQMKGRG